MSGKVSLILNNVSVLFPLIIPIVLFLSPVLVVPLRRFQLWRDKAGEALPLGLTPAGLEDCALSPPSLHHAGD